MVMTIAIAKALPFENQTIKKIKMVRFQIPTVIKKELNILKTLNFSGNFRSRGHPEKYSLGHLDSVFSTGLV